MVPNWFAGEIRLFLAGATVLYAGLVIIALRTEGFEYKVRFDREDPAHSLERPVVWIGVKGVSIVVYMVKAALNILEDASADVGDWVMHRRHG